ncbi:MAG: glycoside hydrolase family 2 [Bacilli bacterium]|nr:glycoside hydrolase family 2 [Bacilli bacterium]
MNHVSFHREDYPRPQFVRQSFINLNGNWSFAFDDDDVGTSLDYCSKIPAKKKTIVVPYAYQTKNSGIEDESYHPIVWYWKKVRFGARKENETIHLNFEGSDYKTSAYIDGKFVGCHEGGYVRFHFDIGDYVPQEGGEVLIALKIEDDNDAYRPRGKQSWKKPWGCWYIPTTGLWKTVWAEVISKTHIKGVLITPNRNAISCECEYEIEKYGPNLSLEAVVTYNGIKISRSMHRLFSNKGRFELDLTCHEEGFKRCYWAPNWPNIYEIEFRLYSGNEQMDVVNSYTAYRIFETNNDRFLLNHNPIYLRLVLEQGYFRNSGMTYESEGQMIKELQLIKSMGFNGLRMHEKVEDERFYYLCDIMGIYVSCEMPSPYLYDYTTVSSTIKEWVDVVKQNYNHPSIVFWVCVNESWGTPDIRTDKKQQAFAEAMYKIVKSVDPIRPVVSNDGWEAPETDICTFHNYSQNPNDIGNFYQKMDDVLSEKNFTVNMQIRASFAEGHSYKGQPIMIDELGGVAYKNSDGESWGYGVVSSEEEYLKRVDGIIKCIVKNDRVAGFCYTQITDVENEQNGLADIDRNPKVPVEALAKIFTQDGKEKF